jgi:ABC-type Fe3+-hydroxamate transport system substrate-binding protein
MSRVLCYNAWIVLLLCTMFGCRDLTGRGRAQRAEGRIVSLSPALTETLFALGVGQSVVAVSDYCHEPAAVERLPRVGTIFKPRYEAVVAARPDVIVAERIDGTNVQDLEKLCATAVYRWLSYEDVVQSTRELGRRFGRASEAEALVARYETVLKVNLPEHAPRVLLAMAHVPGQLTEIWFIRRNSIHGRALEAAGASNAVAKDVAGPPRIGLEQAILLDPDEVIVLEPTEHDNPRLLEDYRRLAGLRAVRQGRLALVAAPELQVPGPRIARLVERLRAAIASLALPSSVASASARRMPAEPGVVE